MHCHNNAHELYNLANDRAQMKNLHPSAPRYANGQNPFESGETTLAGFPIPALLKRIDAALLVLKSCRGNAIPCNKPWAQLHREGGVNNLREAMADRFDGKYQDLHRDYKVNFTQCYNNGRIDISAEGPQWTVNGPVARSQATVLDDNVTSPGEWVMSSNGTGVDETWVVGDEGESEGWWDDWE